MRTDRCLVFNYGKEFKAELSVVSCSLLVVSPTGRPDPSNNLTLAFAPVKQARMEEMLSMATQMGVKRLQPVITAFVNEHHPKWERIKKIVIEAAEQSGRNSVPELAEPQKFTEFLQGVKDLVFADERAASPRSFPDSGLALHAPRNDTIVLIGSEGGFSDAEFDALDKAGATGINLGPTILRAEVAAVVAIAKVVG